MDNDIRTNNKNVHKSAGLLAGLIMGGLAGFSAMLLLAPQPGKKTRIQFGQKSLALQNRVLDTFDDLVALSHFDSRKILSGTRGKLRIDNIIRSSYE